jgi:hypothetical protein
VPNRPFATAGGIDGFEPFGLAWTERDREELSAGALRFACARRRRYYDPTT